MVLRSESLSLPSLSVSKRLSILSWIAFFMLLNCLRAALRSSSLSFPSPSLSNFLMNCDER